MIRTHVPIAAEQQNSDIFDRTIEQLHGPSIQQTGTVDELHGLRRSKTKLKRIICSKNC